MIYDGIVKPAGAMIYIAYYLTVIVDFWPIPAASCHIAALAQ